MAKNEVIYQGLSDLNVLIDDTTANSPDYFRITNLPGEFTAGINIFKFKGNASLFPENSPVYIEVLDANGLPVYYEVGLDLESQEQSAIISVYINEDTVPGNGSITICGQANQSSEGQILDASDINVRWSAPVYIDISKRNVDEIIFDELPIVTITATTGSYTNLGYPSNTRTESDTWSNVSYIYRNGEAILYTSSLSFPAFPSTATNTRLTIYYGDIADSNQRTNEEIYTTAEFTSSISTYSGSGIAYLADPIIFSVNNSSEQHIVQYGLINTMDVVYEQSASLASQSTENTHNVAVVQFSGLQPQAGEIAKIRSYYKSAGVQEYIFSNETDISDLADEFGFTANVVTASFVLPTIHRNDRFDFKFEFINSSGYISKQVLEYRDVLFQGGNTYIGGDDNLITGSLYVAGATGTGVHISGKNSAAMIRSIGYEGFQKASAPGGKGGFAIYSGSVQPLLNASEQYTGVGLELFANTSSYFKYTTSGSGLLDVRTDQFFLGSTSQFISGANGNIEISSSNFHLNANGEVSLTGNINISSGTGFATPAFVTSSIGTATSSLSSSINSTISSVSSSLNSSVSSVSSSFNSTISTVSSSLNSSISSVSSSISSSVSSVSSSLNSSILSVSSSISSSVSSVSSSLTSTITSVSSSLNSSISSSVSSVSSSLTSTISTVSSSLNSSISSSVSSVSSSLTSTISSVSSSLTSTIISVSSSLNSSILAASSSAAAASSSAAIAIDRIVTDSNNLIVKPNNTPNAGAGLYLSQNYLGYYSGSAWNAYVSSSGEFLFKKDNNNQMSFGNNAFILKISDTATISGSNINLLTPNFFLGSNAQYISGSGGNIEISSSNFHLSPTGDVEMSGDINAVNGVFENASITGIVITGSNTAYGKASGLSGAFLLESWFTSSFVRNRASGNSTAALETKFNTGNTFNYGIFGWTASLALSSSAFFENNPLGNGYNVAAAVYGGGGIGMASAGGWENTFVNPGAPPQFQKWKDAVQFGGYNTLYGPEYNGYGNEITASFLGGYYGPVCPTVDQIIFCSPSMNNNVPYSITSSLITIPSSSLGYGQRIVGNSPYTWNADPIGLQFAMRMQSGSEGAGGSITTPKWESDEIYDTFYVQCEILSETGAVLIKEKRFVYSADDWQIFNIPLTPALVQKGKNDTFDIKNKFRIVISWKHSDMRTTLGKTFPTTITNLVAITELRLAQYPKTLGLRTDSVNFSDSFFTNGNAGTQHYGSIYPMTTDTFDLGTEFNYWKSLYANTSSLGLVEINNGIRNPSKSPLGYDDFPSLVVYDGRSDVISEEYYPALVVNYGGNTRHANMVTVGEINESSGWYGSADTQNIGKLYVSGTIGFSLPVYDKRNEFSGEETIIGQKQASGGYPFYKSMSPGEIYFLKHATSPLQPAAGSDYFALWEKASATNVISGSGMLGIFTGATVTGMSSTSGDYIGRGVGLRGVARFSGSAYYRLNSASGVFPGDKLYLSTTPGQFQTWAPTGSGEIIRIIGYCYNDRGQWLGPTDPVTGLANTVYPGAIYFAPETSWIENV